MKRWVVAAAAGAGLLAAGPGAHAQAIQNVVLRNSFNPVGAGARGQGMGGAFIAVADDGTAASFNPAGLAQLRRTEFALVGFTDLLQSDVTVPKAAGPVTTTTSARHQQPDFVGLALPFEVGGHNLTIQLSYQRAVDLFGRGSATVQDTIALSALDPTLKGNGDIIADIAPDQSGAFHTISLVAGYQLTSRLSVGTAINYWIANWTAQGSSSFRLRAPPEGGGRVVEVPLFNNHFHQDQSMRALNLNAGILLKYPRLSIGGIVRLPYTGDYALTENDTQTAFDDAGKAQSPHAVSFDVKSRLHWPLSAGAGVALRPLRGLTVTGDYSHSAWSRASIDDVPAGALLTSQTLDAQGNPQDSFTDRNFFDLLPSAETATVDTSQWRGGAEYLVTLPKVVIPLRGGLFRDSSPVADLGTNTGRRIKGWTLGTGLNFTHVVFDVAFERKDSAGTVSLRLRAGQPVHSNPATEAVREERVVASLIYRFADNDPIKRALHYIFAGSQENGNP